MTWFHSTGQLIYEPSLLTMKNKKSPWWVIVQCCPDLAAYYRFFIGRAAFAVAAPAFGSHISVITDEKPPEAQLPLWKAHHLKEVEFEYTPELQSDGLYFWLPVVCPTLLTLREELGLARE